MRIRNIPDSLWKQFKLLCVEQEVSMNEKVIELIRQEVEKKRGKR